MMQNIPQTCRQPFYLAAVLALLACLPFGNMSYGAGLKFEFPLACIHGQNCWILNYMDVDPAMGKATDFTCGPRTADGQDGVDIAVRDLATASGGVAVLAAADGTVSAAIDGMTDSYVDPKHIEDMLPMACGNMVVIDHISGWQTRYCHLRYGSVQVRPGQRVQAGQILGAVGLSGLTSWPKLKFAVARWDTPYDPYTGRTPLEGCGLSSKGTLWKYPQDVPYRAFAIYNLGFGVTPPQEKSLDNGLPVTSVLPSDSPSLTFWATLFDALKGDIVEMRVTDPRNIEIMNVHATLPKDQKKRLLSVRKPREGIWRSGVYTGTITITRGIGKDKQESEWSTKVVVQD